MTKENESEDSFNARMKRFLKITGSRNMSELAKVLSIKPPSVSGAVRRGKIPDSWYKTVSTKFDVSTAWLMFGDMQIIQTLPKEIASKRGDSAVAAGLKNSPESYGDSKKVIEKLALDMNYADFEKMWDQFRSEKESRRGWLQVELIKKFPEFIEWLESAPEESPPS